MSFDPHSKLKTLPVEVSRTIPGYTWEVVRAPFTPSVFRLTKADQETLFLKMAHQEAGRILFEEKERLEWIGNRLPIPQVHLYTEDGDNEYLIISEIIGIDGHDPCQKDQIPRLVQLLADGLQMVHRLPIEDCPFDQKLNVDLSAAKSRLLSLIDPSQDEELCRVSNLFDDFVRATKPDEKDLVFTHGDYGLPNIRINQDALGGIIDWGEAGIADRYRDLAMAAFSVKYFLGAEWVPVFFEEYGIGCPDQSKMDFYVQLRWISPDSLMRWNTRFHR